LRSIGQWETMQSRLARRDTVGTAHVLVERGEAGFGFVSRSDVIASRAVREVTIFPPKTHSPVHFVFGLTPRGAASPGARMLLDFLASPTAAPVWRQYGLAPTGG